MKKKIVFISTALLSGIILCITSCSKDDVTAPVVKINGNSSIESPLNATYTDLGASATDDQDGSITVITDNPVNKDKAGDYTITYTATDKAGNSGTATRLVSVYNEARDFEGSYLNCYDSCALTPSSSFNAIVALSDSVNRLVKINNFGAYGTNINVFANITSNAALSPVTIAVPQSLGGTATVSLIYQAGTNVVSGTAPTSFQVSYKWDDGINNDICNTTYIR